MISYVVKRKGLTTTFVWFAENDETSFNTDFISYMDYKNEMKKFDRQTLTLVHDLQLSKEDLMSLVSKSCGYEIRRAYREDIKVFQKKDDIDTVLLDDYLETYMEFLDEKQLPKKEKSELLDLLMNLYNSKGLVITYACKENQVLTYHSYVVDGKTARLLHSISLYRTFSSDNRSLIGYANRLLHFEDMLFFKNQGYKLYDWGGISDDPEILNITRFKKAFGGTEEKRYFYKKPVTIKAKIVVKIKRLLRR